MQRVRKETLQIKICNKKENVVVMQENWVNALDLKLQKKVSTRVFLSFSFTIFGSKTHSLHEWSSEYYGV